MLGHKLRLQEGGGGKGGHWRMGMEEARDAVSTGVTHSDEAMNPTFNDNNNN